ncbi:MAG: hypothetical protein ACREEM_23740 [Blastocatellia bacterium]
MEQDTNSILTVNNNNQPKEPKAKKPYSRPNLIAIGNVIELTHGGKGSVCDGASGMIGMSQAGMPC